MIPQTQSRMGKNGRCLNASIASILEVPEADVPDFSDADYRAEVDEFLKPYGLRYIQRPVSSPTPEGWHLIEGISPRGGMHAVVGYNGEFKHDPHPAWDDPRRGLVKPVRWGVLEPLKGRAKDTSPTTLIALLAAVYFWYKSRSPEPFDTYDLTKYIPKKRSLDRSDMLQLRKNTEKQGGPFFMQETTKSGKERTIPVCELSKGADTIRLNMDDFRRAIRGWHTMTSTVLAKCIRDAENVSRNLTGIEQSKTHDLLEPLRDALQEIRADGQDRRARLHRALDRVLTP